MGVLQAVTDWGAGVLRRGRQAVDALTRDDRGVPWPPEDALPRLRAYELHRKVYQGAHEEVFTGRGSAFGFEKPNRPYTTANLCGSLTQLLCWRLFGEGFTVGAGDDTAAAEFFSHLSKRNLLNKLCLRAAIRASWGGDCVFKLRYDARQSRVVVNLVDPAQWYPTWDPADEERLLSADVATVLQGADDDAWLWIERHEFREDTGTVWIVNLLFALKGDPGSYTYHPEKPVALTAHPVTAALPDEQDTGLERFLLVHVANGKQDDSPFGYSDYTGLLELQGEVNNRMTGRGHVLDALVRPLLYGPEVGDECKDAAGRVVLEDLEYLEVAPGQDAPIGAFVWDASLGAVDSHLDDAFQLWAAAAGIELSVILPQDSGGPVSGRALKLGQTRTQARVLAKQLDFEPALRELFSVATELATLPGVKLAWAPEGGGQLVPVDAEDITVVFSDGLPTDTTEEIEEQARRKEVGLQTTKAALVALDDLDEEQAAQKAAEIDAEATGTLHLGAASGAALQPMPAATLGASPQFLPLTGGASGETANP